VDTTRPQRVKPKNTWNRNLQKHTRGQQASSTAGGRWRWQHRTELDGEKWSVAYVPLGARIGQVIGTNN